MTLLSSPLTRRYASTSPSRGEVIRLDAVVKIILSTITILFLTACAVGPDFTVPEAPETDTYSEQPLPKKTEATKDMHGGAAQEFNIAAEIPVEWWELFHSPELNAMIEHGIENSPNMRAAEATLRQAQENLYALIGSTMLPKVTAGYSQQEFQVVPFAITSGLTGGGTGFSSFLTEVPPPFYVYNATVNVSYTLDVFGGYRRSIEASAAQVDYQLFELAAVYLTLTSNIVTTAVKEASLRAQIKAVNDLITIQEKQLGINRAQYRLGGIASTAVLAQETQLAQTQALLPPLEKDLTAARNALAVLIGDYPGNNKLPKFDLKDLHLPTELPVSMPARLVRQRPDVQAAEATLHATTAQIGVATANLLPSFPLTGSLGTESGSFNSLFGPGTKMWNWQAQVLQTIFNGGALLAQRRAAIAGFEAAYAQYQQTVLTALQNVSDTLKALEMDAQALKATTLAEKSAKKTLAITQEQYKLGGAGYLDVIVAETKYLNAYTSRILAEAARFADTAALFQAMGGAWWKDARLYELANPDEDDDEEDDE
jgi:NodT family efflux transporter outer membrane factor (OMF) lipoprotein